MVVRSNVGKSANIDQRFVLCTQARFQLLGGDKVEATLHGRRRRLPLILFQVLQQFAESRSVGEVYRTLETDMDELGFAGLLAGLAARGLLIAVSEDGRQAAPQPELSVILRKGLFDDPKISSAIRRGLREGRAIVIPDAFRPALAEKIHAALAASTAWTPYQGVENDFHFSHHNISEPHSFPDVMIDLQAIFASTSTKRFMARLSGRDCAGELQFGASQYLPGDYSLPHDDAGQSRTVAFVWHLAKDWQADWGGALFWAQTGSYIRASFNTLTLFNVSPATIHFVTPVSPYATGRRISVNGWWTSSTSQQLAQPSTRRGIPMIESSRYGKAARILGGAHPIAML